MSVKSIVTQITKSIAQLDELLNSTELKDGKRCDAIAEKSRLLTTLLQQETSDRQDVADARIAELTAHHETDTREVERLQAAVADLQAQKATVIREIVPDPEHAAVRQQSEALTMALKLVTDVMSETERQQIAIHAIQKLDQTAARLMCGFLNLNYVEQTQMLRAYTTDAQLHDVIAKARCEGPAVVFARAALAMRDAVAIKGVVSTHSQPDVPDTRTGEQKLQDAKAAVRRTSPGAQTEDLF